MTACCRPRCGDRAGSRMRTPSCAKLSPIWASVKKCCRTRCSDRKIFEVITAAAEWLSVSPRAERPRLIAGAEGSHRRGSVTYDPAGVKVYVAGTPVDFRHGATGLKAGSTHSAARRTCSIRKERIGSRRFGGTSAGRACLQRRLRRQSAASRRIAPTRVQLNHAQLLAPIGGLDWPRHV
jgi:transposase